MLRIGDNVSWRCSWGAGGIAVARVCAMEVTEHPRSKTGDAATVVSWDTVKQNRVIFTLSSGKWAYASQIAPLGEDPTIWHT
jgi:hypothetical protein